MVSHYNFLITPQKIICARCSEDCGSEQAQSRSESLVKQKGERQQGCNEWERYLRVEKLHGALGWLKQAEMLSTMCDTLSSVLGLTRWKRRTDTNELPSDLSLACVCAHILFIKVIEKKNYIDRYHTVGPRCLGRASSDLSVVEGPRAHS